MTKAHMSDNIMIQITNNYDQKKLTGNLVVDLVVQL